MRQPGTPFWDVYRLFNIKDLRFDGLYWKAAAYQTPKVHTSGVIKQFNPSEVFNNSTLQRFLTNLTLQRFL